jgi:serine phosphatase RsbU (regulator of sigma subunit)
MALSHERRLVPRVVRPAAIGSIDSDASALERAIAADVLLRHLFVPPAQEIKGTEYAAIYRFAQKHSGGDVIDVYTPGNGTVCYSLTDISGKGVSAALHAGLVKYGIRAYASEAHRPKTILRSLNRFYMENDEFEGGDSFASIFFARYDSHERSLTYAAAGHEGLLFCPPGGDAIVLGITGPVVGVIPDSPHLYGDNRFTVLPGSVLVAVSDGITEARNRGKFYGMERLVEMVQQYRDHSMQDLACAVTRSAAAFAHNHVADDMAVLAVRFE